MDPSPFNDPISRSSLNIRNELARFDHIFELIDSRGYAWRIRTINIGNTYSIFLTTVNSLMAYFSNFAYFSRFCNKHWKTQPDLTKSPMFGLNCPLVLSREVNPGDEFRTHLRTIE
mmetsp:Transcript_10523/g.16103  ORF Transcript_10523/g.16103 Transcript_10523/m.16103 type:complete len:116 (-) Transcript_10523:143-490(-)